MELVANQIGVRGGHKGQESAFGCIEVKHKWGASIQASCQTVMVDFKNWKLFDP